MIMIDFLQSRLNLKFDQEDIIVAHRLGQKNRNARRPQLMVIRVATRLKEKIMSNTYKLKKEQNEGFPFFINQQLPDALNAEKRDIQYEGKQLRDANEALPPGQRKIQFNVYKKKTSYRKQNT